jgi:hypothetical protein
MTDEQWKTFFETSARVLGPGDSHAARSGSWCGWTTFASLSTEFHYWSAGLPASQDIGDGFIKDNGVWRQPFLYRDLAHLVIPREFFWEICVPEQYSNGTKRQDLESLSSELTRASVPHRVTDLVLEVKLY